jgi:antitoxin component YwqK of YwqJK toxin-antitoxin module
MINITETEKNMIRHEITINKVGIGELPTLDTFNRDLKKHREGGLPAFRGWHENGTFWKEEYYLNGKEHREGDLPALRIWYVEGSLWQVGYYQRGELHREDGPAYRQWYANGNLAWEEYYLNGEEYDPT